MSVKKEHARFLLPVFICILTSQATMVVDAAIGGNLLGSDAVSAVNLTIPVYDLFYAIVMMLGMGACTVASMAYGRGDVEAVRKHFTGAVLSSLAIILLLDSTIFIFKEEVLNLLCGTSTLRGLTSRYLIAMIPYSIFSNIAVIFMAFTSMAGRPMLVMLCSFVQFLVNVTCNILLIRVFGFGIEALAYSSLISSVVNLSALLPAYFSKECPFRIINCHCRELLTAIKSNIHYGSGFLVISISYMVMAYGMNFLVLKYAGEQAFFCWSVVMMIFLTGDYATTAANETILLLGGKYFGMDNKTSCHLIYKRSLFFAMTWIGWILLMIFILPRHALPFFGAADYTIYSYLIPVVALAIPFVMGSGILNIHLTRLILRGEIRKYMVFSATIYIAVPVLFALFHLLVPEYEQFFFLALIPIQFLVYKYASASITHDKVELKMKIGDDETNSKKQNSL